MGRPKKNTTNNDSSINESKKNEIGLFDIIKYLFTDSNKLNSVPTTILLKNAFMINRYMSIMYPQQANILQINKINQIEVIKFWSDFLKVYNNKVPGWVYTKGQKRSLEETEMKKKDVSSSLIKSYCNYYNISIKDVNNALMMYYDEMVSELNDFDKNINKLLNNESNE